jgi:hypothetical protein
MQGARIQFRIEEGKSERKTQLGKEGWQQEAGNIFTS